MVLRRVMRPRRRMQRAPRSSAGWQDDHRRWQWVGPGPWDGCPGSAREAEPRRGRGGGRAAAPALSPITESWQWPGSGTGGRTPARNFGRHRHPGPRRASDDRVSDKRLTRLTVRSNGGPPGGPRGGSVLAIKDSRGKGVAGH
eukprot:748362-Hanusia_phi.AAC.1